MLSTDLFFSLCVDGGMGVCQRREKMVWWLALFHLCCIGINQPSTRTCSYNDYNLSSPGSKGRSLYM